MRLQRQNSAPPSIPSVSSGTPDAAHASEPFVPEAQTPRSTLLEGLAEPSRACARVQARPPRCRRADHPPPRPGSGVRKRANPPALRLSARRASIAPDGIQATSRWLLLRRRRGLTQRAVSLLAIA